MKFYKLTHPRYADDLDDEERNPAWVHRPCHLPGMSCERCHIFSTSDRLRVDLPVEARSLFSEASPLPPHQWHAQVAHWATMLGVEPSVLIPGMEVGPPNGLTIGLITQDVVHPFPGVLWVQDRIRQALVSGNFKGLELAEVELERGTEHPVPRLWEIVALGKTGIIAPYADPPQPRCPICGRDPNPTPGLYLVDLARWDGSDVFTLDSNPNHLLVTERVREVLERIGTSNVAFKEIESQ